MSFFRVYIWDKVSWGFSELTKERYLAFFLFFSLSRLITHPLSTNATPYASVTLSSFNFLPFLPTYERKTSLSPPAPQSCLCHFLQFFIFLLLPSIPFSTLTIFPYRLMRELPDYSFVFSLNSTRGFFHPANLSFFFSRFSRCCPNHLSPSLISTLIFPFFLIIHRESLSLFLFVPSHPFWLYVSFFLFFFFHSLFSCLYNFDPLLRSFTHIYSS